jgi:SET domain-containing protein
VKNKPLVYVDKSAIHGDGIFAHQNIPAGTWIGSYEGRPTMLDGIYVLWVENAPGEGWIGYDGSNDLRFLNHARPANAEMDGLDVYASVDVATGEEVTIDYGEWFEPG